MEMKSDKMKKAIQEKIGGLMERVMEKVTQEDPFDSDLFQKQKPLYAALVPDEIFQGAHFERRFVTPFGSVWEDLAVIAADNGIGYGRKNEKISGTMNKERLSRINKVLNDLEHRRGKRSGLQPDWKAELSYILEGKHNDIVDVTVICDVTATDNEKNKKYAFEIKAPLPNSDQTKVSKEKILKLYAMSPRQIDEAYYALPYNPYGKKEEYVWPHPFRWFDMRKDESVLIGSEFWEKIGGQGTYQIFIDAVNEIGVQYKERIYREYLGIEPSKEKLATKISGK